MSCDSTCSERVHIGTVDDVAALLRVSKRTVIRLAGSGELPCTRIGKLYRFNLDAIDAMFDGARPDKG